MRNFLRKNWLIIAAIIYVLSPIDFIPDVMPLVGQSDDLLTLVIALLIRYLDYKKEIKTAGNKDNIVEGEIVE